MLLILTENVGRDSVVSIETRYWLDGPGINPGGEEIYFVSPVRLRGPFNLLYNGYQVIPGCKEDVAWR